MQPILYLKGKAKEEVKCNPAKWTHTWFHLMIIVTSLILLTTVHQALTSFMMSMLFLGGAMVWWTLQLNAARSNAPIEYTKTQGDLSFGHVLALLLLLEPLSKMLELSDSPEAFYYRRYRGHAGDQ